VRDARGSDAQLTGSKEFVRGDVYLRDMKNTKWVHKPSGPC